MKTQTLIRLDSDFKDVIQEKAAQLNMTMTAYIEQALLKELNLDMLTIKKNAEKLLNQK